MILYVSCEGEYFQHVVNDQTINLFNESIKRKMHIFISSRVTLYNIILSSCFRVLLEKGKGINTWTPLPYVGKYYI